MASANSCPLTGRNFALQRWRNHQPTAAFVTTADVENTFYPNDSFLPARRTARGVFDILLISLIISCHNKLWRSDSEGVPEIKGLHGTPK
jgi:hypothetical protein